MKIVVVLAIVVFSVTVTSAAASKSACTCAKFKCPSEYFCCVNWDTKVQTCCSSGVERCVSGSCLALNESTVLLAANQGSVAITSDQGNTWSNFNVTSYAYKAVYAANSSFYIASGEDLYGQPGAVMVSNDAGNTWSTTFTFNNSKQYFRTMRSFSFLGDKGYAVGDVFNPQTWRSTNSYIFATADGGWSWKQVYQLSDFGVSIAMHSCGVGVVVGKTGTTVITNDGGVSWNVVSSPNFPKNGGFTQVVALDCQNWIVSGWDSDYPGAVAVIWKSSDSGKTWKRVFSYDPPHSNTDVANPYITAINFVDDDTAFAIGYIRLTTQAYIFGGGFVLKTEDGGATWKEVYYVAPTMSNSVIVGGGYFWDENVGIFGGFTSDSFVFKTSDGAQTFNKVSQTKGTINAVSLGQDGCAL